MSKEKKYYVVWKGIKPGIYDNWNDCKMQVEGFENAQYKSYKTLEEAQLAFSKPFQWIKKQSSVDLFLNTNEKPILDSISVDAACSGSTLKMEYQGVNTATKKVIFKMGPFDDGTNNAGEFLAIVHALALCKKENIKIPVYSDSLTAISWIKKKKANTKLKRTEKNEELFNLIERAENWLKENIYSNQILKWLTQVWGEIPADFGRK
ncbi:MAG: ribonuclease H [Bacteroidetes bacterium GWA2_32_17]|nr:MAG: ribonuclease H [Bacteroidetes bacterium GWA2_32_17]